MTIKDWIKIEEAFTKEFGWDKGIDLICSVKRNILHKIEIEDLNEVQVNKLKHELRRAYEKQVKLKLTSCVTN